MDRLCISSLVVQVRTSSLPDVVEGLNAIPEAEVLGSNDSGKLVVLLDTAGNREAADRITEIQNQDGVLSASLVYQYDNHHESQVEDSV